MIELVDDQGRSYPAGLVRKPMLCLVCRVDRVGEGIDSILCFMNRSDQQDDEEFHCEAFQLDEPGQTTAAWFKES